jgi:predicted ATPase/class 3 adenylate cyclase/Tfp pilus assembly protein PilF
MTPARALLLTDVVDSTKLSHALGDTEMARLWAEHDRAARALLAQWRGREIEKTDGLLALFDSAADAAGFALDYHRALVALEHPLVARAAIHVGPMSLRESSAEDVARGAKRFEVDGLAKPITARVMATALGRQTLLTSDARQALGETPLRVQSHGHWRLKGLPEPIELFELGDEHAPFTPPPDDPKAYRVLRQRGLWVPVREVRHSVPAERDSFVGRQEPLQRLAKKLEGGARLVSVLGLGGTGKTRLVTRFAWTWLGEFPGGVWFCDLSQARSVDDIALAVAQGLDVPLGRTDPVVHLARAIAGRGACLVILDNFEQVAKYAEETLGHWLDRAPQARFVVTSRELLGVVGEQTLALAPLPMDDAATLFQRRAEAVCDDYEPSAADTAATRQLVKVLDGLPLAIELAAARVRGMRPQALLERMHERFEVLWTRAGRRDRQATLRAAFDWSWELLSEPEKAALAQLSVFHGGFTLESARAVLELSTSAPGSSPGSDDVVQWLVDKSFVRQVADDRFDLLESVRDYAAEHLRTAGRYAGSGAAASAAAEGRHGAFFAALGARRATDHSCIELDNVVVACRRAVALGDGAVAARALVTAWGPIELQGPFRIGVDLSAAVCALPGLSALDRVGADLVSGAALQLCGQTAQALDHLMSAASGAAALGERLLEGRALHILAPLQARAGHIDDAAASYERALAAFREVGDPSRECALLNNLGAFSESLGRVEDARHHYENGLRVARLAANRRWEGGAAGNLAQFHANQGRPAEARPLYAQAVLIARELGDRQWEANARCNLGLLEFTEGRLTEARAELEASLTAAREMGHVQLLSIVQCNLGLVAEASGDADRARSYHEAAIALARDLGDRRSEGQFLGYLGVLHARQSRFALAEECLAAGETLLRAVSDRVSLGIVLCARAEAQRLAGEPAAAESWRAQAEQLALELADVERESEFGQALQRLRDAVSAAV